MRARAVLATAAGRLAGLASRLTGRGGGTAISGLVALRLDSSYVARALNELGRLVLVTGTNGKTTTTALVASAVRAGGGGVLTNTTGSNLERGLASVVVARARLDGKIPHAEHQTGVFETDEWAFASLFPRLRPSVVVLLNLFRDQLDRYGEVERTATAWSDVLAGAAPETMLVVNADDPVLVAISRRHRGPVRYFGIDGGPSRAALEDWADVRRCPICESRLVYRRVTFAHLGHYRCVAGDLERPETSVRATAVRPKGLAGLELRLEVGGWEGKARVPLPGLYNAYNVAAAVAAAQALGVPPATALEAVAAAEPPFGRAETVPTPHAELVLLLVKNPAGANQTLDMLASEPEPLDMLVLLNDDVADGQDVSWIWDEDYERLAPRRLTVGGRRAHDLALRLKYAEVSPIVGDTQVLPGIAEPLDAALATASGRLAELTTYTAMLDLRAECVRRGWTVPYWSAGP